MAKSGFYMPVPGEPNAPVFDPSRPSEICRYFAQLERLFERAAISHDQNEMKFYTTLFVDPDLADLWEAFPEFTSPSSTFGDLKSALIGIYAGFGKYKPSDLHALISATNSSTIGAFSDLSDFHMRFQEISSDLITFGHLDTIRQTLAYPRGFPPTFWNLISQHLMIKFPDHRIIDPYPISDIFDAARFVIHMPATQATPPSPRMSLDVPIKPKFVAATARNQISSPTLSEVSSPSLLPRLNRQTLPDHIKDLEKELELLRSQQAIFAHPTAPKAPEIPGYAPPHVPNFGSIPPRCFKPSAPPGLCAPPQRSSPTPQHSPP